MSSNTMPYYTESEVEAYYAQITDEINYFERILARAKKERAAYVAQAGWSDEDCAAVDALDIDIRSTEEQIKELIAELNA